MVDSGNNDVASQLLRAKMKGVGPVSVEPSKDGDDDSRATLLLNGELPPTKAPSSKRRDAASTVCSTPTILPSVALKRMASGANLQVPPVGAPTIIGASTSSTLQRRGGYAIGAKRTRTVPCDAKTLASDDIHLPFDEEVKEEYEDEDPQYEEPDFDFKVCKGSVRSSGLWQTNVVQGGAKRKGTRLTCAKMFGVNVQSQVVWKWDFRSQYVVAPVQVSDGATCSRCALHVRGRQGFWTLNTQTSSERFYVWCFVSTANMLMAGCSMDGDCESACEACPCMFFLRMVERLYQSIGRLTNVQATPDFVARTPLHASMFLWCVVCLSFGVIH